MMRSREFVAITMGCVALVEYEDQVLCPAEQQLRTCLPTYVGLIARAFQHVSRSALRTLTTTSSPPRGADPGRRGTREHCVVTLAVLVVINRQNPRHAKQRREKV